MNYTDKETYIEWAETQENLPIFFRPWYLDKVSHYGKWDAIITAGKSGIIEGVWVYYSTQRYKQKFIVMPPLTPFGGIWIPELTSSKPVYKTQKQVSIIRKLLEKIPQNAALYRQTFVPQFDNWLPFFWKGYQQTTRYTFIIEDIQHWTIDKAATNVRNKINKASTELSITNEVSPELMFDQVADIMQQKGMPLIWSKEFFLNLDGELSRRGKRIILGAADKEGRIHATAYIILDGETAYLMMLGSDTTLRQSGAIPFVIYHAIRAASDHVNRFDFEGSVMESLFDLFSGFGGTMTPCYSIYKTKSILWEMLYMWKTRKDKRNR